MMIPRKLENDASPLVIPVDNEASDSSKIVFRNETPSKPEEIIYFTSCSFISEGNSQVGQIQLTFDVFKFVPQGPSWIIKIKWQDLKRIAKINRRGIDKGIEITTNKVSMMFASMHDRDDVALLIKMVSDAQSRLNKSVGFSKKDEAEVIRRLTPFKAPIVFEESVPTNQHDIMQLIKSPETMAEMYKICGCHDIAISGWTRNKDGLTRTIQYTQDSFQSLNVASTQTLMKSGDSCVLEVLCKFSRSSAQYLLQLNMQFFFKQDGELTNYRGAYAVDWIRDVWDKEFVEAAVKRQARMFFFYIKAKLSNETFDATLYDGQWRQHQPYVLVIIGLILAILSLIIFPHGTNWYGYLFGSLLIAAFYYL